MKAYKNFPLSTISYYRIGGSAKILLEISDPQDFKEAVDYAGRNKIFKILPLGVGANVIISEKGFKGVVFHFVRPEKPLIEKTEDGCIKVFAGHLLDDLIQFSFKSKMVGLEWAGGLPSTVGAAIRGNVGAFGESIEKSVVKVEIFDLETFSLREFSDKELEFGYRDSFVKRNKNLIILNSCFKFQDATTEMVLKARDEYKSNIQYRQKNHPMEYPSCGSVFKNITKKEEVEKIILVWSEVQELSQTKWHGKISMGYIIDRLGFAGRIKGGAQVSLRHANYIVNKNSASFIDVVGLIAEIKESFYKTFGFFPETEVEIVY